MSKKSNKKEEMLDELSEIAEFLEEAGFTDKADQVCLIMEIDRDHIFSINIPLLNLTFQKLQGQI